jgi:hypothetical protein
MNKRIKELEKQATEIVKCGLNGTSTAESFNRKKFAELVIKECVAVIRKEVSMKYKDGGETEEFMGGHYAASVLARVKIKQHFGVE